MLDPLAGNGDPAGLDCKGLFATREKQWGMGQRGPRFNHLREEHWIGSPASQGKAPCTPTSDVSVSQGMGPEWRSTLLANLIKRGALDSKELNSLSILESKDTCDQLALSEDRRYRLTSLLAENSFPIDLLLCTLFLCVQVPLLCATQSLKSIICFGLRWMPRLLRLTRQWRCESRVRAIITNAMWFQRGAELPFPSSVLLSSEQRTSLRPNETEGTNTPISPIRKRPASVPHDSMIKWS
jgi:hypothetical protein